MTLVLAMLLGFLPVLGGEVLAEAFTPPHDVIRIGINAQSSWAQTPSVQLTNSAGLRVGAFNQNRRFVPHTGAAVHTTLHVTSDGGTVRVVDAAGNTIHTGATLSIGPVNESVTTNYRLPNATFGDRVRDNFDFFGGFRFTGNGGNLIVVNYVDLEDYLKGVVPYEAIPSWPLQVLKAQAVAARTYAVRNFGRFQNHGFDLTNTVVTQVYRGMHAANANTNLSVTGTRGQVMLHNGQPIEAVYHSASGGATENSGNVWLTNLPYLRGRANPHEVTPSDIRWTRTLTADQFLTHMRTRDSAFNLPDIVDVQTALTPTGNVFSITFVASNGATQTYQRERARHVVATGLHPVFNSQRFTITRNTVPAMAAFSEEIAPQSYTPSAYQFDLLEIYPYHSELELIAMKEAGMVSFDIPAEADEAIDVQNAGVTFTIQNFGFGHNVGMSQHGAASMARAGRTFTEILHFYYYGITITGQTAAPGFVDVPPNAWFYDAVEYVRANGLMSGTSPTTFAPAMNTTRGMFVTILGRMAGINPLAYAPRATINGSLVNVRSGPGTEFPQVTQLPRGTEVRVIGQSGGWLQVHHNGREGFVLGTLLSVTRQFVDVSPGAFYAPYAAWAVARGVSSGTGGTGFSPSRVLVRQEMASMLYRYTTAMGITLQRNTAIAPFRDIGAVADWARGAVTALQQAGIVQGTGAGEFIPLGANDRASMASLIARFHQQYG